jgi:hypothetical protein
LLTSAALLALLATDPAKAAELPSVATLQGFAQPNGPVFVLEHLDAAGRAVVARKVEPLTSVEVRSPVERRYNQTLIRSYGITPCPRPTMIFGGREVACAAEAARLVREGIANATVVLCRAFAAEQSKPVQQANCYELNRHIGRVMSTDDGIVFLGLGDLEAGPNGAPLRPDLVASRRFAAEQRIGIHGVK